MGWQAYSLAAHYVHLLFFATGTLQTQTLDPILIQLGFFSLPLETPYLWYPSSVELYLGTVVLFFIHHHIHTPLPPPLPPLHHCPGYVVLVPMQALWLHRPVWAKESIPCPENSITKFLCDRINRRWWNWMLIHMWDKEIKHMEAKNLRDCTEAEKIHARMMENKRMDIKVLQEEARLMALKVQLAQLSSGAAVVLTNSSPSLLSLNCHSFCPRFFRQHWQFTYHCHECFSHLIPMFIILMHPTPGPASLNDIFSPTCASLHIYLFPTCTLLFYPLSTTHSLFFFDSIVVVLHVVQHLYKYIWYFCSHNPCLCTSLSINNLWNCWPSPQLLLVSPGGHLLFPTTQPLPSLPRPSSHLPTHPSATLQGELPCFMLCKIIQHIIQYMATCKLLFFLIWR